MYNEKGWLVDDETSSEVELRELLSGLLRMLKPELAVETGCFLGRATLAMARAVQENHLQGSGDFHPRLVSCDVDPEMVKATARLLGANACTFRVELRQCRGEDLPELPEADFVFCDSDYRCRAREIELAKPGAVILVHDTRISYDSEVAPLEGLVRQLGGICFDSHRGWGLIRKA